VFVVALPAACGQILIVILPALADKDPMVCVEWWRFGRELLTAVLTGVVIPFKYAECLAGFHFSNTTRF
jgi:hypothetical protein